MVLGSMSGVTSFEEKITHGDESEHVFRVNGQAFLKVLSCLVKLHLFKVDHTELAVSLVVLRVFLDTFLIVGNSSVCVVGDNVERFTKSKRSGNRVGIEFQSVFEILCGLLLISLVSEHGCKMNTSSEMLLVENESLLQKFDSSLVVF